MISKDQARINSNTNPTSGRAETRESKLLQPSKSRAIRLSEEGEEVWKGMEEDWSDGRTGGRAPTMLKTDRPSSYVSYGEEYEKQRTRAGQREREREEEEGGGRAMRR